jgi:hypothetical protein
MPADGILKASLIIQRNGLLIALRRSVNSWALSASIFFWALRRTGRALGAGRAVMVNSLPFSDDNDQRTGLVGSRYGILGHDPVVMRPG